MKEMTATEVARNFSSVLDAVKGGESIVITRGGEQIATLVPTPRANGAALAEAIRKWREDNGPFDDEWAERMYSVRGMMNEASELDRDPWRE